MSYLSDELSTLEGKLLEASSIAHNLHDCGDLPKQEANELLGPIEEALTEVRCALAEHGELWSL